MNNTWSSSPSVINIELTNICSKSCWMCGRRKLEKDYPEKANFTKNMPLELVYKILDQVPSGVTIQFHNSGDPLCYLHLKEALTYRTDTIRCFNTNGKLLLEKANEIIDNLETLAISVIENDEIKESDNQFEIVKKFLEIKGDKKPYVGFRLLGDVSYYKEEYTLINILDNCKEEIGGFYRYDEKLKERWYKLAEEYKCLIVNRVLHNPMGSYDYERKVTIPETLVCLDLLNHLVIDVEGDIYPCVRFNPNKINKLGNIKNISLKEAWNSEYRQYLIKEHLKGNRGCNELCKQCHFYGCPTGG